MFMISYVKPITHKDGILSKNSDSVYCKKSFLIKKNRWYAGMFYTYPSSAFSRYGLAFPMIGYRHINRNGTFFGFTSLIIPEFDMILYSFLFSGYQLGVPLNCRKNMFFYFENGFMYFHTSKSFWWHIPNFYLNYEKCFSKKIAYSLHFGGYIGPALGEESRRGGG